MPKKLVTTSILEKKELFNKLSTKSTQQIEYKQLKFWGSPKKPAREASPYLQIKSVAVKERVNPKEISYELLIYPHAFRACGGQYSADEAHKIYGAVKKWDWVLDENNRPHCLRQLEALIDNIINSSSPKGGLL